MLRKKLFNRGNSVKTPPISLNNKEEKLLCNSEILKKGIRQKVFKEFNGKDAVFLSNIKRDVAYNREVMISVNNREYKVYHKDLKPTLITNKDTVVSFNKELDVDKGWYKDESISKLTLTGGVMKIKEDPKMVAKEFMEDVVNMRRIYDVLELSFEKLNEKQETSSLFSKDILPDNRDSWDYIAQEFIKSGDIEGYIKSKEGISVIVK